MDHSAIARNIVNKTLEYIYDQYKTLLPKNFEENKGQLKIYVAKTTSKALKEFLDGYRRLGIGGEEFRRYATEYFSKDNLFGLYVEELLTVFLDLEKIRNKYPKDDDFQKSAFYLTAIHEVLHSTGELGAYKGYLLEWLNDGIVELLTREIAGKNYPKIVQGRWDPAYSHYTTAVNYLNGMVGKETVLAAFFKRDVQPIIGGLKGLGLSDAEIERMFAAGSRLRADGSNFQEFSEILKGLNAKASEKKKELDALREANAVISSSIESASSYLSPWFEISGTKIPEKPAINPEDIAKSGHLRGNKAAARLETLRRAARTFGGFQEHEDAGWLDGAILEHLSRRIMREYYLTEFKTLDWATLEPWQRHAQVSRMLADLIGERTLERAFAAADPAQILEALSAAGFTKDEIKKLVELGKSVGGKTDEWNDVIAYLNHLRRKRRRMMRNSALIQLESEIESGGWEAQFGKAGPAAAEAIAKTKSEGKTLERRIANTESALIGKNLLPDRFRQVGSIRELRARLADQYNGGSEYLADIFINAAEAHLALQKASVSHEDIAGLAYELSSSFSEQYFAKPTLQQLVSMLGEEIYYMHSHPVPLSEFFGMNGTRFEKENARIYTEHEAILRDSSMEERTGKLAALYGLSEINDSKDLENLFIYANYVAQACNRPVCESDYDIGEIILLAKAKLGDADGRYSCSRVRDAISDAMGAWGAAAFNPAKGVSESDAHEYSKFHLERREGQAKMLESMCQNLNDIYAGSIITFEPLNGFGRYSNSISKFLPAPPGLGSRGSMGKFSPYAGLISDTKQMKESFKAILRKHNLKEANPLEGGPLVAAAKAEIRKNTYVSEFGRFAHIFQEYRSGGAQGIKFDMDSERPGGFLAPEEVLKRKYALCLEHTCLFLELASGVGGKTYAFKVFRDEEGNLLPHVTAGVFIAAGYSNERTLAEAADAWRKPPLPYRRFEVDGVFRSKLLEKVGTEGYFSGHLVLLDLSLDNLGAQYQHVEPIVTAEEMLSAYFVDRGSYNYKKGAPKEALADYETALKINPFDQLARSHLVAYYSDIEYDRTRVLDLTKNHELLVNTEDFISRGISLLSIGHAESAVEALLRALQLSEDAAKAKFLLKQLIRRAGSDAA